MSTDAEIAGWLAAAEQDVAAGRFREGARLLERVARNFGTPDLAEKARDLAKTIEANAHGMPSRSAAQTARRAEVALGGWGRNLKLTEQQQIHRARYADALATVPRCAVIGGHGYDLGVGDVCELVFKDDALRIYDEPTVEPAVVPLSDIVAIEVGGPGARRSGGGYLGGGFGIAGAAEGMLIAAALNRATTKITITTVVVIQTNTAEIFLNNSEVTPDALRMKLSPVFTLLRQRVSTDRPATLEVESPVDLLRKLGELRDAGILTQEEFDAKKAELLARM